MSVKEREKKEGEEERKKARLVGKESKEERKKLRPQKAASTFEFATRLYNPRLINQPSRIPK